MTFPAWTTFPGFLFTATELQSVDFNLETESTDTNYLIVSGSLPSGVLLSSTGTIYGIPSAVNNITKNKFVVRAQNSYGIADRTFEIDVVGSNAPTWYTLDKYLKLGIDGESYALNNQWVNFQFSAVPTNATANTTIQYYIADNDGKLPPGLILEKSGRLSGFIKDDLGLNDELQTIDGYDYIGYDTASYDYYSSVSQPKSKHFPKLYQFRITATDGFATSKRTFIIVVVDIEVLEHNILTLPTDITLPTRIYYLQKPQFLIDSNLGTIKAGNNHIIPVNTYDPEPLIGTLTYSTSNILPSGLSLDSKQGYLHGYVPYQPAYALEYDFLINATKVYNSTTVITTKLFNLTVKGEVESTINWISTSSLGTIENGVISEISVIAEHVNSDYSIKYSLTSGELPNGLELKQDGSISGSVNYGITGDYTFTVRAGDVYNLSAVDKTFKLSVIASTKEYTKIYIKPFLSKQKRNEYLDFISNTYTFPPKLLYRYFDPNFGIQPEIKCILEFGIEKINLVDYTVALRENFYRRKFSFGKIKLAIAKNSQGEIIYEVVYADIIDNLVNNSNISVSTAVYSNNDIYYPASIDNMKQKLELLILNDYTYIDIKENYQPRFMQTAQEGEYKPPGYMRVMPICYALPGQGVKIIERIKISGFNFNLINFEVDRIIVENSADYSSAKYLLFERDSITDKIESDDYLFGPEGFIRLEDEDNNPLIRE